MPRSAREKCGNNIYHVCVRGNNKESIFFDDEDREEYLKRVRNYEERYKISVYAYCLMTNHVHLLIYDNDQDISRFMQGLNLSYVIYINRKYGRSGHLFQDRFTSVMIKSDTQLIYASKYIHLNPVRAKIVAKPEMYRWSSYIFYMNKKDEREIIDYTFLIKYFSDDIQKAKVLYQKYVNSNMDQDKKNEEEIATTEEGVLVNDKTLGLVRRTYGDICEKLGRVWNGNIRELICKGEPESKERRMILIYLVGLLARKSYKEVSLIMQISVCTVYKEIKCIVNKLIGNQLFRQKVNLLIKEM